jgi:hypothetical protein
MIVVFNIWMFHYWCCRYLLHHGSMICRTLSLWTLFHSLRSWARWIVCTQCCATQTTRTITQAVGWLHRLHRLQRPALPPRVLLRCAAHRSWQCNRPLHRHRQWLHSSWSSLATNGPAATAVHTARTFWQNATPGFKHKPLNSQVEQVFLKLILSCLHSIVDTKKEMYSVVMEFAILSLYIYMCKN